MFVGLLVVTMITASIVSADEEINLLYTSSTDCTAGLAGLDVSGECIAVSNCTFGTIQIQVEDHAVCSLTTFGALNSISAAYFGNVEFYFNSDVNANSSASRADLSCSELTMVTSDTFIVESKINCYSVEVALPVVTGLINVSLEE
mmetsp:Transcript_58264/g.71233  ORF Transcript_58264/g.71233 Transcript_58264/m.71233 type:complete len:146 (-) Transcript_58264:29-466(-)